MEGRSRSVMESSGITIWGERISLTAASLTSRCPRYTPLPSCRRTHCAISITFELIEPAGPTLSTLRQAIARNLPEKRSCGVATSPPGGSWTTLVLEAVMPSGVKMRRRMKSSQVCPVTAGTICPAARNMMF